jgi:ADP-L-glycero-D-manno-heptose 6-epimerase
MRCGILAAKLWHMTLYLAATPSANDIFNIGSEQAHSWNEVAAAALFASLGVSPRIEYIEMPEGIGGQPSGKVRL